MVRVYSAKGWCSREAGPGSGSSSGGAEVIPLLNKTGNFQSDGWQDPRLVPRLFVSGDRSQVGKSSSCLGLLASLVEELGYKPNEVAYIKPATQCESVQLVAKYCVHKGIDSEPIGPVVYVSGFTREFLAGNTPSSDEMAIDVERAVDKLCSRKGRRLVVVDGVGFPAVGSIVGLSNAVLAHASRAPVVLICPKGVGNAIDSWNMNRVFFEHHGIRVLGALFNRFPLEGFYSLESCKKSISAYFQQNDGVHKMYGCLPELEIMKKASPAPGDSAPKNSDAWSELDEKRLRALVQVFKEYADVPAIIQGAVQYLEQSAKSAAASGEERREITEKKRKTPQPSAYGQQKKKRVVLSREEIKARAMTKGAKGGG